MGFKIFLITVTLFIFGCAHTETASITEELDEKELVTSLNEIKNSKLPLTDNKEESLSDSEESETETVDTESGTQTLTQENKEAKPATISTLIPSSIAISGATKLNRYYFLREGDNPDLVSKLIYGTSTRANSLLQWNGKKWSIGEVLLYSSPKYPDSEALLSYYDEEKTERESYTVQPGDSLSRIAKVRYQSMATWKEIAAINHLKDPNFILAGQVINLLPRVLKDIQVEKEQKLATSTSIQIQESEKPQPHEEETAKAPLKTTEVEKSKSVQTAAMDFIEGIPLPALTALGSLLVLILCFSFWRRAKRSD